MKKFLLMAVMAVAALTASAQKGEFHVTPHIALGYTHITNGGDFESNLSGKVGADVEYMVSDAFGLSLGLDYDYIRSLNYTEKIGSEESKIYTDYSYLNIPVLAQYHFGEGWAIKAGVQPMFLLAADLNADYKGSNASAYKKGSIKDAYESFVLAVPVGISYTFDSDVTVDLRCNIPTGRMDKDMGNGLDSNRMIDVAVSVGYRF